MPALHLFPIVATLGVFVALSGCNARQESKPAIGHAFAGPATLKLHQEIDTKSATVAVAHHGDALDIVGQRRRWYKVRTAQGVEGWTSDREWNRCYQDVVLIGGAFAGRI